jgi:drug/metabolite transporter (DMT)-like permease
MSGSGSDLATLAALGALFFGLFPWAFSASLYYTTASRGAISLATIPIQTLLVAVFFGRETLTRNKILSVRWYAGLSPYSLSPP